MRNRVVAGIVATVLATVAVVSLSLRQSGAASRLDSVEEDGRPGRADTTRIAPALLREDLRVARESLEEGHPGLYAYLNRGQVDDLFRAAERAVSEPRTSSEFFATVATTVCSIQDGHTVVLPPASIREAARTRVRLLPFSVRVIGRGVFVYRDLSGTGSLAGHEIRAIGGVRADDLVTRLFAATCSDAGIESAKASRIGDIRFASLLNSLVGLEAPFEVVLRNPSTGAQRTVRLQGESMEVLTRRLQERFPGEDGMHAGMGSGSAADLEFLEGGRIAQLTIRSFHGTAGPAGQPLDAFIRSSFDSLAARRTQALILDLRDNGGGMDSYGSLLVSHFVGEPFRHYEDIYLNGREFRFTRHAVSPPDIRTDWLTALPGGRFRLTGHPVWGIVQPEQPRFGGLVFVLMNGGSFSTTAEVISQLHAHRVATFLGEEAGGAYRGNTAGWSALVRLPNSGVEVGVPLVRYAVGVPAGGPAGGVMPDHRVRPSIQDLLAGRDPALDAALAMARSATTP